MRIVDKALGAGVTWLIADKRRVVAATAALAVAGGGYGINSLRPMSRQAVCAQLAQMQTAMDQAPSYGFGNELFDAAGDLGSKARRLSDDTVDTATRDAVRDAGTALKDLTDAESISVQAMLAAAAPIQVYCSSSTVATSGSAADGLAPEIVGNIDDASGAGEWTASGIPAEAGRWIDACQRGSDQLGGDVKMGIDPVSETLPYTCELHLKDGRRGTLTYTQVADDQVRDALGELGLADLPEQEFSADMAPLAPGAFLTGKYADESWQGQEVVAVTREVGGGMQELYVVQIPDDAAPTRAEVVAVYTAIGMHE